MQKPSIGRIVHFIPSNEICADEGVDRVAAIITAVESDSMVNLKAFFDNSFRSVRCVSVPFKDVCDVESGYYWEWPPRVE